MADVFVIIRYHVSHGEGDGDEIAAFASRDEAQGAFDAGRASGDYVDDGDFRGGRTGVRAGPTFRGGLLRSRRWRGGAERPRGCARDFGPRWQSMVGGPGPPPRVAAWFRVTLLIGA